MNGIGEVYTYRKQDKVNLMCRRCSQFAFICRTIKIERICN